MLTHRGLDAWLEDSDGRVIEHTNPTIDTNKATATVAVKAKSLYTFRWRRSPQAGPISAWCQIFNSSVGGTTSRVAHTSMDETRNSTQSRTSKGVLELPLKRFGQLRVPHEGLGSVWLEIRRTRGPPVERDVRIPKDPGGKVVSCEIDMDLLDDPTENKLPWVILQFDFKRPTSTVNSLRHSLSSSDDDDEETLDGIDVNMPRQLRKDPAQVQRSSAPQKRPRDSSSWSSTSRKKTKVSQPQEPEKRQRKSSSKSSAGSDIRVQFEALNEEERHLEEALARKLQAKRERVEALRKLLDDD